MANQIYSSMYTTVYPKLDYVEHKDKIFSVNDIVQVDNYETATDGKVHGEIGSIEQILHIISVGRIFIEINFPKRKRLVSIPPWRFDHITTLCSAKEREKYENM